MKLDRLLSIVIMLLNRQRVQAKDLADHFKISVRTIYRDIDAINRAGIPIVTHQGHNGGLEIVDNYKIDRQILTLQDMVSMLSVLKGMNSTFKDRQIDNAIEKIHALVPQSKQEYVRNRVDQIIIDVMPWGMNNWQKDKMLSLQKSIAGNHLVKFSYRDSNGTKSQRTVEPMTLIFKATSWYIFAYCHLRNDFRIFKLTRIDKLEVLEETFTRKAADYREYDRMYSGNVKMIRLVIRFSQEIRHNVEDYFEKSCLEYLKNGDIKATFELPDNDWVISYLLSLGEHAEVLKPEKIRIILQEKAKKVAALYQT